MCAYVCVCQDLHSYAQKLARKKVSSKLVCMHVRV